jgi:hypothetical protein
VPDPSPGERAHAERRPTSGRRSLAYMPWVSRKPLEARSNAISASRMVSGGVLDRAVEDEAANDRANTPAERDGWNEPR